MVTRLLAVIIAVAFVFGSPGAGGAASKITSGKYAYTTASLNLRSGPGKSYSIKRVIPNGGKVYVRSGPSNEVWYRVRFDGTSGYVHGGYLSPNAPSSGADSGSGMPVNGIYVCGYSAGEPTFYSEYHKGYDVCSRQRDRRVFATSSGTVRRGSIGYTIVGDGVKDLLWHLVNMQVADGANVRKGQYLGTYAKVGLSTAPHLHWERRYKRNGAWVLQYSRSAYGL